MAIEFTEQQTRVLQARKHNILVSAAAGSGKTAVLVERIVRMISEGDEPMNIDRLLVVTFTKAAAAQMRERIGAAIAARIEEEPDNVHLQKQETLLHNAQITTMDSFFTFLLRNNFSDIDMDPGFRQMDQTEAELMRKDAMEEFLEEGYAQEDPSLKICADYFCRGAGDRELEEILETLYKQAVSHPDPVQWLRERASDYHVGSREELYSTAWMQFIILTVAEKIEDLKRQYERLLDYCSLPDGPALYIPVVREDLKAVSVLGDVPSAEEAGTRPAEEMEDLMDSMFDYEDDTFTITTMETIEETMETMMGMMSSLLAGIASIALVVGGIGIMNMMLTTVTERTVEIGLKKALGAIPWQIQAQFLIESFLLSTIGGAAGIVLGLMLSLILSKVMGTGFVISTFAIVLGAGFSAAVGIIFGWAPARKASKLNPIDALRSA